MAPGFQGSRRSLPVSTSAPAAAPATLLVLERQMKKAVMTTIASDKMDNQHAIYTVQYNLRTTKMAAYRLYQFTLEELQEIQDDLFFQEAVSVAVAIGFNPHVEWYTGDPAILQRLDLQNPLSWWSTLREEPAVQSLAYLTPVEYLNPDLNAYLEERDYLLTAAAEGDLVAKWSYMDMSHLQAILITASLVYLLFSPEEVPHLYLHIRDRYVTLANHNVPISSVSPETDAEYIVFDPLLQTGSSQLPPPSVEDAIVPFRQAVDWLYHQIAICGYPELLMRLWAYRDAMKHF